MLKNYPLLDKITDVRDLKALDVNQLPQLCTELRDFLIYSISKSSGHFASNLGTVELTVSLHYVYSSPEDKIIWDVGHQAYPHKVLTGRKNSIETIRHYQGLHPFPFIAESKHDILTVGHSSTSISAAVGISIANQRQGKVVDVIPVIGDGAITAGMAFEALNHVGDIKVPLTIVLNDNNMSISPNKGALNRHTDKIFNSQLYQSLREKSKEFLPNVPFVKNLLKQTESTVKNLLAPELAQLYTTFGIEYIGPVDGHNVIELVKLFQRLKHNQKLQLVHVLTTKGKGYKPAEQEPTKYHGVSKFDPVADLNKLQQMQSVIVSEQEQKEIVPPKLTYSQVFGNWLCEHIHDDKFAVITPAMIEGSGITEFNKIAPQKCYDVAIAEQHAVTLATGLAIGGMKPVVAIYSTFLQRAYDQLIHDVAIDNHPVLFAIDRAGIVGEDGQTHQGAFDLSYLRAIPNVVIAAPSSAQTLTAMLNYGYAYQGAFAVRYPRGKAINNDELISKATSLTEQQQTKVKAALETPIALASGVKLFDADFVKSLQALAVNSTDVTIKPLVILSTGTMLQRIINVAAQIGAALYDLRFIKPLDPKIIRELDAASLVVILEENSVVGGAASAVREALADANILVPTLALGISDSFVPPIDTVLIDQVLGWEPEQLKERILTKLRQVVGL